MAEVTIKLNADEALTLFDALSRFETTGRLDIQDQAEQRVLWDILANLESQLASPMAPNYSELLASARARVRDAE
jgi:hypothetical protein